MAMVARGPRATASRTDIDAPVVGRCKETQAKDEATSMIAPDKLAALIRDADDAHAALSRLIAGMDLHGPSVLQSALLSLDRLRESLRRAADKVDVERTAV